MTSFEALYEAANRAGMNAVQNAVIQPMIVGSTVSLFSNAIDKSKLTYFVEDGVCGFAWINIKPGNGKFANYLKKVGLARPDHYYGGVTVWVSQFNQSLQKKEAYARAFAKVLTDNGIKAYASSRMD